MQHILTKLRSSEGFAYVYVTSMIATNVILYVVLSI